MTFAPVRTPRGGAASSERRDHAAHGFIAGGGRAPRGAVPPLVVELAVRAGHEHVEAVRAPRRHPRLGRADATHGFVAGKRRTPRGAVPPLVVELAVRADYEHVEAVRAP